MHYLVTSQYFWPEPFRVNDLVEGLIARGHRVTVLTGWPNYPEGKIFPDFRANRRSFDRFNGVEIIRVPVIPRGNSIVMLLLNYVSFAVMGSLYALVGLRGRQFDVIFAYQTTPITQALPAVVARWRFKIPSLMWILDLWPEALRGIGLVKSPALLGLVGKLVTFVYRRTDRILVQSNAFTPDVIAHHGAAERVRYFPSWAEPVFGAPLDAVEALPLAPFAGKFLLLFAGNIGEAQDFPAIVGAAELIRDHDDIAIVIAGEGRDAAAARQLVIDRGLTERITFIGRHPLEAMPGFFGRADGLLVSLKRGDVYEMTIPGKVQTYLAAGRPIIGMLDGAGAEVVRLSGGGLCGAAGDSAALAANILALKAMSPDQRAALGASGKAYCADEFNRDILFDRFVSWSEDARAERLIPKPSNGIATP